MSCTKNNYIYDKYTFFYFFSENLLVARVISILILLNVILGFLPFLSSILHWYISYSFVIACDVTFGGDNIASNITFLLIPFSIFQNKYNHFNPIVKNKNNFYNEIEWFFYIAILIQISLIYFQAFCKKIYLNEWKDGTAVYYYLTNNEYGLGNYFSIKKILQNNIWLIKLMTWGTLFLEFFISIIILIKHLLKNKILYNMFFIFAFFHFILMICFGIMPFFIVMIGLLMFYLLPKDFTKKIYITFKSQ